MTQLDLGLVGPAQSDHLYHFTGRTGARPAWVPAGIQQMTAQQRLDGTLREERFLAFPPFGSSTACVCLSESPPDHLGHLIRTGRFSPWGVVTSRASLLSIGGGAVAYVPDDVHASFRAAGLEHWSVRTGSGSVWMHEREWRLPSSEGARGIGSLVAVLVGDASWRPSPVVTGWEDESTGQPLLGPEGNPFAQPVLELPRLWRESQVWVWNAVNGSLLAHAPGVLR
ncbi:hypothetical protein ACWD4N_44990 [Streptomyces sp. NPDC002586]